MRFRTTVAISVLTLAFPGVTRAQSYESVDSLYGYQVSAGGGVVDFFGNAASHLTKIGGFWDVCLLVGSDQIVGFEAAYTGTANNFNNVMAPFVGNTAVIGTSLEGNFRLQPPRAISEAFLYHLQPYAFIGAGWNNYTLTNPSRNMAAVMESDNMFLLPWGAGAQVYVTTHFTIDGRYTFRNMFGENLLHTSAAGVPGVPEQSMNQWAVSARLGYAF
jgi:hypothetical protein